MRSILRFLISLAAPFILIFGGGALIGLGSEHEMEWLMWTGAISILCGLLWGLWLWLMSEGSLFD